MDIQQFKPEVFEAAIDMNRCVATILQIVFGEAVEKKPFMSPTTTKCSGGTIKFSKSNLPILGKRPSPNSKVPAGSGVIRGFSSNNTNPKKKTKTN